MYNTVRDVKIPGKGKDRLTMAQRTFDIPGYKPIVGYEIYYAEWHRRCPEFGQHEDYFQCCNSEPFATREAADAAFEARLKSSNPFITVSHGPGDYWTTQDVLNMERA